ncbi:MAG: acetylglutamate kinase [Gemmatimonadetes bacterium]|nr:acetylglutamate kinase [Gemmatimonadota bacterium]
MTRVIKIGGRAQGDAALAPALVAAHATGERLCVVHGGGDEVTTLQRALGQEPVFVNGRRATSPEELSLVRMVLSGTVNKRLVGAWLNAGLPAVGLSGEDGNLLTCDVFGDGSLGAVGQPRAAHPAVLHALLDAGFVPVISPVGRFAHDGSGCNVNGDDAAAAIAGALQASELLLVADVDGFRDASGATVAALDAGTAAAHITSGVATGGMIAKLEAALRALDHGVTRVRIGGVAAIADATRGTVITRAPLAATH